MGAGRWSSLLGVRRDRRERTSRTQGRSSEPEGFERRSPALIVTQRDVAAVVALITLMDTIVKLLLR
jgi:hypothetical protein